MKYEEIIKNKRLTDFAETRQAVIDNVLRNIPKIQKDDDTKQKRL